MLCMYLTLFSVSNVAAITTPDAKSIVIKPWDKTMFRVIEKAIIDSEVGIMPENNGEVIRLGIPPLTEERRRDLVKQAKQEAEDAKIGIRNHRKDANSDIKKLEKDGTSEDLCKTAEDEIQKLTDTFIKKVEEHLVHKEAEIMKV